MLPDVNVLIHAINSDSPRNERMRNWWDEALAGPVPVFLPWAVMLGFLRITTNTRLFRSPLSLDEATAYVDEWLSNPVVRIITVREGHWELVHKLLKQAGTGGNLTTDAHLAALAIQWDCVLCSTDTDFARFAGLKWRQL